MAPARPSAAPAGPWGSPSANANARPMAAQPMQQAAPAAGGGFMRSAMATAAGVAGGMLAANAISGMLGGNHAHAGTHASQAPADASNDPGQTSEQVQPAYDDSNNDPGNYTEPTDTAGGTWDGGGDVEL